MFVKTGLELQPASDDQEKQTVSPKRKYWSLKNKVQAGKCLKTESSEILP